MKFNLDKQYFKYSFYAFIAVAMSIVFYQLLDNMGYYLKTFRTILGIAKRILSPFIIGAFVAYLINPGVRWFEKGIYSHFDFIKKRRKLHRLLSVVTMYFILVTSITMLILYVAPQIGENISDIVNTIPEYIKLTNKLISNWVEELERISTFNVSQQIDLKIRSIFNSASETLEEIANNLVYSILTITSGVLNFVIGLIVSFYLLMDKESFKGAADRILRILIEDTNVEKVKAFGREVDDLFAKFIVGKSIDSIIIGGICLIGLWLMDIRFALLISVIITVTNMIPYFGPFIGAVPATIITFFDSPVKAFWIMIFIFALQQFDGLILGPKILGDSVGVSPFWIIFSIVVGGKLFGVLGMFLGVPVIGILRVVINRFIEYQLEQKELKMKKSKAG